MVTSQRDLKTASQYRPQAGELSEWLLFYVPPMALVKGGWFLRSLLDLESIQVHIYEHEEEPIWTFPLSQYKFL